MTSSSMTSSSMTSSSMTSSSSSDLALSDFSLMMKEFREQSLKDSFNTPFITQDFQNRWAQHPQLGLWLETAWHVGYQFQLGILEQLSRESKKFNRTSPFSSAYELELHFPSISSMTQASSIALNDLERAPQGDLAASNLNLPSIDGLFNKIKEGLAKKIKASTSPRPNLTSSPPLNDFRLPVQEDNDDDEPEAFSTPLPFSYSQENYSTKTRFSSIFHSIVPSLLNQPLTPEILSQKIFKMQHQAKNNSTSFNLTLTDCLQLLEVYQHADPQVWHQTRLSHRQAWMAQQWGSLPTLNPSSIHSSYRQHGNPFFSMSGWFCFHLLPTSLLPTSSSFSLFKPFIESHLNSSSSSTSYISSNSKSSSSSTSYYEGRHGRFMIPQGLHQSRSHLLANEYENADARYYRWHSSQLIKEFFNPHLWESFPLDSMIDQYTQSKLSGVLHESRSVHVSDRPRLERFRQLTQWLQQVARQGLSSVTVPNTSLRLDVPLNTSDKDLDPFLGVTSTQWNNLVVSMNPENFQSDRDLETLQRQWIECWIEHQPSDHKRKIRADIRKNLKAQQSAQDDASHDADPLLHEIFQAFTGQALSDDAQGSSQLKQNLQNNNLSSAGWKALHKNTSFQELMLRNLMSSEQWRLRQLSIKQKNGDIKISTKDRELLLEQQRLKNMQSLNMTWMNDVLSASAEYGFSTSDTKVLLQLISYHSFSDWVFSQGQISASDVISMNEQDWNQWWDGVDVEHRQRQGLWKVWMKDAVDTFASQGGLSIQSLLDAVSSIKDVQRAEAPHDFFTQLATQYKKTPFRSALKWHDAWVKRVNQQKIEAKSDVTWPTPWTQMNATLKEAPSEKVQAQGLSSWLEHLSKVKVQELNSERLLSQEGLLMHHCVGSPSFARESKNQNFLIFHLQHKTHELGCTLTLERDLNQKWVIQQNKGKYNSCVKDPDLLAMTKAIKDQINLYEKIYTPESTKKKQTHQTLKPF